MFSYCKITRISLWKISKYSIEDMPKVFQSYSDQHLHFHACMLRLQAFHPGNVKPWQWWDILAMFLTTEFLELVKHNRVQRRSLFEIDSSFIVGNSVSFHFFYCCISGFQWSDVHGDCRRRHFAFDTNVPQTVLNWPCHAITQSSFHRRVLSKHRRAQQDQLQHKVGWDVTAAKFSGLREHSFEQPRTAGPRILTTTPSLTDIHLYISLLGVTVPKDASNDKGCQEVF